MWFFLSPLGSRACTANIWGPPCAFSWSHCRTQRPATGGVGARNMKATTARTTARKTPAEMAALWQLPGVLACSCAAAISRSEREGASGSG